MEIKNLSTGENIDHTKKDDIFNYIFEHQDILLQDFVKFEIPFLCASICPSSGKICATGYFQEKNKAFVELLGGLRQLLNQWGYDIIPLQNKEGND